MYEIFVMFNFAITHNFQKFFTCENYLIYSIWLLQVILHSQIITVGHQPIVVQLEHIAKSAFTFTGQMA